MEFIDLEIKQVRDFSPQNLNADAVKYKICTQTTKR